MNVWMGEWTNGKINGWIILISIESLTTDFIIQEQLGKKKRIQLADITVG